MVSSHSFRRVGWGKFSPLMLWKTPFAPTPETTPEQNIKTVEVETQTPL